MTDSFPIPPASASFEERGDILRVSVDAGEPTLEFRVDDGMVFARLLAAGRQPTPPRPQTPVGGTSTNPDRQWSEASLDTVLALFTQNSPVASWLRHRGVDVLRLALLDIGGRKPMDGEGV